MIRKAVIVALTIAAIVAVLSFALNGWWYVSWEGYGWGVSMLRGAVHVQWNILISPHPSRVEALWEYEDIYHLVSFRNYIWLPEVHGRLGPSGFYEGAVIVPLWTLSVVFGAYPAIAFIRGPLRRRRRHKRGECVACGYDLTGNVSGVCPECGTEIGKP